MKLDNIANLFSLSVSKLVQISSMRGNNFQDKNAKFSSFSEEQYINKNETETSRVGTGKHSIHNIKYLWLLYFCNYTETKTSK